jgi:signal transduction histidine kinase
MTSDAVLLGRAGTRLAGRFSTRSMPLAGWFAMWAVVLAAEFGALLPLLRGQLDAHPVWTVLRLVGGSFAACGLIAWRRRPDSRIGPLMTATGFAFFVSPLLGQVDAPLTRTLSYWVPDLWLAFFVPLLLTFLTGGRLRTRTDRIIVATVVAGLLLITPVRLMFQEAPDNLLLVRPDEPVASALATAQRVLTVAALVAALAVIVVRFGRASAPGRRALLPAAAGAVCLAMFVALIVRDALVGPSVTTARPLDWAVALSIVIVPVVFLVGLLRSRLARGGLVDLFATIRVLRPAQLQAALAGVMGDADLVVAYRRADGSYVDADGATVALPGSGGDRSVAGVDRNGDRVAALIYDPLLDDDPELVQAVQAAVAVALDNRQLQAEVQAHVAELRASRERIIAAGDAERRRIERNLHDGAQQRLVVLAMQLALVHGRIRTDPADAEALLAEASDELARSLTELRELAAGIHPSALDHGLDIALEALAVRSAVPTTVTVQAGPRLPEPVAFAAYCVTSEALANIAKHARAGSASVRVARAGGRLLVEIEDDGVGGADPAHGTGLRGLADRVEALGGTLRLAERPGGGTVITAEITAGIAAA